MTVGDFWPVWRSDAGARLAQATMYGCDRLWIWLVKPRFAEVPFADFRLRYVAAWRGQLLTAGIGKESVRMAMGLLQAMFTVATEWGEAETNPVQVVRKAKQGRTKAIRVISPNTVERIRGELLRAGERGGVGRLRRGGGAGLAHLAALRVRRRGRAGALSAAARRGRGR